MTWTVVVPVKRLARAKTRLRTGEYADGATHAALVLAMAADVVTAGLAAAGVVRVVVVTDDPRAAALLAALGARVVADLPDRGLNAALEHGATLARQERPDDGIAALSADLAAVRPEELAAALAEVRPATRGVVADATGTGTTLLAAARDTALGPAYGPDSFTRHRAGGAADLTARAGPGLRRDVDTVADLQAAAALGLGPHSAAAVRGVPA